MFDCLFPAHRKGENITPFLYFLVFLCLLAVAWAPALAQDRREGKEHPVVEGGIYRRPLGHEPVTFDPARIADIYSRSVAQQIFDGLVQFDQTLTITPSLAESWKASRDGLTWTFTLRKGVKFHHGREVNAEDVVYSFTRILDPKVKSGAADLFMGIRGAQEFREGKTKRVSGLVSPDRYTVQVTLNEALAPFVSVLAVGHAKVVPKDVVERQGEGFGAHPIGTGPFKFVRWERGKEIVLQANLDYFGSPPKLSRIVYRVFPGERFDQMYEEFQKGNLEDTAIPNQDYRGILARGSHVYLKRPMFSIRHYGFNTRLKPFDDKRVRQAIIYAIDRKSLIENVFFGRYNPATGVLPLGTMGFNPNLKGYSYDPQKARELLAQAGYPGGRDFPSIQIWSSLRGEEFVRWHEQIGKYLEAVGIRAEIHYLTEWPSYLKMMSERKLPVFLRVWSADVPDPDNFLFKLFYSQSSQNFMGYSNRVVDDLLLKARSEKDPMRRVELYRKVEQLIVDDAPIIPIWYNTYERLFQPYVRSVEVNGLGDPYIPFRKIWLDRK